MLVCCVYDNSVQGTGCCRMYCTSTSGGDKYVIVVIRVLEVYTTVLVESVVLFQSLVHRYYEVRVVERSERYTSMYARV